MPLKNTKQESYMEHWLKMDPDQYRRETQGDWGAYFSGVDRATKSDITVLSMPCPNCGTYRTLTGVILEKCWDCGDDEMDLSMPTIYDQEENADEAINQQTNHSNPTLQAVSPVAVRSRSYLPE